MKACNQCGAPITSDSPEGLCARCLLSIGMKEEEAATVDSAATQAALAGGSAPAAARIDIADAAEVARRLPQFEILELLGRGGMGVVYKARQLQLDRIVALKILPPADATSPGFVERFRREARSLAKLSHTNIVSVYDFGETNGLYYFVMEFVDGMNLRQMILAHRLTAAEALSVVPKICDALQFAHDEGVVHRDIKPENILLDKRGRVKIADFGLAKLLGRAEIDPRLTVSGATLGTPRYMAPEQMDKPETVDHRADIYSLGVVFYEMLTGEVPMGRFAPPSAKVQIDVRLDEIVLHALERDVERRYQHASQVRDDVEKVTSKPPVGPGISSPAPAQKPAATDLSEPRLSRLAVCGVIWAGIGMLSLIPLIVLFLQFHRPHQTIEEMTQAPARDLGALHVIVASFFVVLAASAMIGTTIVGAVAIGQIKRSAGKLYGLRLAVADLLCFPLLVPFGLIASLGKISVAPIGILFFIPVATICFFIALAVARRPTASRSSAIEIKAGTEAEPVKATSGGNQSNGLGRISLTPLPPDKQTPPDGE